MNKNMRKNQINKYTNKIKKNYLKWTKKQTNKNMNKTLVNKQTNTQTKSIKKKPLKNTNKITLNEP
jgi:hypothetical protein